MSAHHLFMQRALELAQNGHGQVAPNPMVGCVVVHNNEIIGEGWHKVYGGAHAEVNAITSVTDKSLLPQSVLHVTLEPCNHFGKTPPCTSLIIDSGIKQVVIASSDPNPLVSGKGIARLQEAGVKVETGILKSAADELNKRFFTFHQQQRPFVVLKYAQTADGYLGLDVQTSTQEEFVAHKQISGNAAQRLTHRWRSEEQAVLVGANTVINDNPQLNVRYWQGKNPVRVLIDAKGRVPLTAKLFDGLTRTIVFTLNAQYFKSVPAEVIQLTNHEPVIKQVLNFLYDEHFLSVLVEGGATTLSAFIDAGMWDEARIFTSPKHYGRGIKAPGISGVKTIEIALGNDSLSILKHQQA